MIYKSGKLLFVKIKGERNGINMEKRIRKKFRWQINQLAIMILFYNFIMFLVALSDMVLRIALICLRIKGERKQNFAIAQLEETILDSGWSSIVGVTAGIIIMFVIMYRYRPKQAIFRQGRKMTGRDFWQLLSLFMSGQLVFMLLGNGAEFVLNEIGYTMMGQIESASAGSTTVSMFLYGCIAAPIGEEIVYRGFVLRYLERFGKHFAIVVSSVLFGVMHCNFVQGVFAFFIGLVLGYVAVEYSIKWSIFLHFVNNCIFGDLLTYFLNIFPETAVDVINFVIIVGFFIAGLVVVICQRKRIAVYFKENRASGKLYLHTFTAVWMIVFILMEFSMALMGIEKLV